MNQDHSFSVLPRLLRIIVRRCAPGGLVDGRTSAETAAGPGLNNRCGRSISAPLLLRIVLRWPIGRGDLIVGKDARSAIGTLVERHTRTLRLLHLPDRDGETLHDVLTASLLQLPRHLVRSLTWDQGTEMARHRTITQTLGAPVYFCDTRSPWQRGTNENTNGLLRDYFPKGTDLSKHNPEHLLAVEKQLNHRPR